MIHFERLQWSSFLTLQKGIEVEDTDTMKGQKQYNILQKYNNFKRMKQIQRTELTISATII